MTAEKLERENRLLKQEVERLKRKLINYKDVLSSQLRINIDNEKKVQLAKEITLFNLKQRNKTN